MNWKKVQDSASVITALAASLTAVVAVGAVCISLNTFRRDAALSYCNLYFSNATINKMASTTYRIGNEIGETLTKKLPYSEIKENRGRELEPKKKEMLEDHSRDFFQLTNYYTHAIDGVDADVFDESIIRNCLSIQMVCFREKYAVRLGGLFEIDDPSMEKIRNFIINGDTPVVDLCEHATEKAWYSPPSDNESGHDA